MINRKIKVLVVDDTALYRKIVKDVLNEFNELEVIGSAPNGKIALNKIESLHPDLITLDQEMPEMDGLETLRQIKERGIKTAAIMVSSLTTQGAVITMKALNYGAFDFIAKPDSSSLQENIKNFKEQFKPKIEAFVNRLHIREIASSTREAVSPFSKKPSETATDIIKSGLKEKPKIVAIGISTGGPKALADVIPQIPAGLGVPIVIVQHMPPVFTKALADSLDKKSPLKIIEGSNGQELTPDTVYIAPGGKQMKVEEGNGFGKYILKITDDPPENHCKPSADYLFRSVAGVFPGKAMGVIMTGMGRDGTVGLRLMKRSGAKVLAQDEKSCVVYGMPMEAVKAGVVDLVLPLNKIAGEISKIVKGINN